MQEPLPELPSGYCLDIDSDILILRRLDGRMITWFSVRGADPKAVRQAAEEDLREEPLAQRWEVPPSDAIQPSLQARFFGHFELLCNGDPVDLGRNVKALAIFKYLLAHRDGRVSRDQLIGWMWPQYPLKQARSSLNMAIYTLRKLLIGYSADLRNWILLEEGYYRLSPTVRTMTDVDEFDAHYDKGRRLERNNRIEAATAEYEKAVELYRDDYLLEHLYDDWTMVERQRLSDAHMYMLERLAAYYQETKQLRESMRICYRILERDRAHEKGHLLLTEAYVLRGFYGRALHQYTLFKRVLRNTYNTEPSVETQKRFDKVIRSRVTSHCGFQGSEGRDQVP